MLNPFKKTEKKKVKREEGREGGEKRGEKRKGKRERKKENTFSYILVFAALMTNDESILNS